MKKLTHNWKIGGFALFLGLASCASAPVAHAGLFGISEQEEIEAGQQARAQAIKEYGQPLPANDPRQIRVTQLGAIFARQSQRKNIPYSYTVLQNNQVLNAFAAPGGPIFVTTKLLETAANDAELAYVLGHETGHIENQHIVKAVEKQQKVGLAAGILGAILGGSKGGNVVGTLANVGVTLWSRGYSRDQEEDSDDYGVRAMSRAGFNPTAAITMLGKLGGSGGGGISKYLATHPQPEDRQARVQGLIQKENLLQVAQKAGGAKYSLDNRGNGVYNNVNTNNPTYNPNRPVQSNGEADLRQPILMVTSGQYRVVMAPVNALANWAGGEQSQRSNGEHIAQRGNDYIRMREGSTSAVLNGRTVRLSAPPQTIRGVFYAPLGSVVSGLGGRATYDGNANVVRIDFSGGRSGVVRLP